MVRFIIVLVLTGVILIPLPVRGGDTVWQTIKKAPGEFLDIITHPRFVAILDYVASAMHVYYDASTDAVFWQIQANRDKSIDEINDSLYGGSNFNNIHYYKNMSRLALAIKGYCIGISIAHIKEGKMSWDRLAIREFGMLPGMMTLWQLRYKYCRYGNAWDSSAERNRSRYVIPWPTGDIKIGLRDWQVCLANILELSTSSAFIAWDVTQEFKQQIVYPSLSSERLPFAHQPPPPFKDRHPSNFRLP